MRKRKKRRNVLCEIKWIWYRKKERKGKRRRKNKLKNIYEYQQWQREQNEKAIKHNQDIDKLEKEKLKEQ